MRISREFQGCEHCKTQISPQGLKAFFTVNVGRTPFPETQMTGFHVRLNILFVCQLCLVLLRGVREEYYIKNGLTGNPPKFQESRCPECKVDLHKHFHFPWCRRFKWGEANE